jgi:hypothetical protein
LRLLDYIFKPVNHLHTLSHTHSFYRDFSDFLSEWRSKPDGPLKGDLVDKDQKVLPLELMPRRRISNGENAGRPRISVDIGNGAL